MANSNELIGFARTKEWADRVTYFALKAAIAILAEDIATPNHDNRLIWAGEVLDGTDLTTLVFATTTNATVATDRAATTDNDLEFVVNSMVDHFARG